jgi:hypothetical protein
MKNTLKIILIIFLFQLIFSGCATNTAGNKQIIGNTTISYWMNNSGWDKMTYERQNFTENEIREFQSSSIGYQFYIFASSTCLECASSVPYFFKLLEQSNTAEGQIFLYGLDEYWEEPSGMHKKFKINELPLIFAIKDNQITRIPKEDFTSLINLKQIFDGAR